MGFELRCARIGDRFLISLAGEVEPERDAELTRALRRAIKSGSHRVVVDLQAVTWPEPSLLALLHAAAATLAERGRELVLVTDHPATLHLLETMNTHGMAKTERTLAAAVAA